MSDSLGFLSIAAYVQARGLYGAGPAIVYPETPADGDLGATHKVPFSDESFQLTYDRVIDPTLDGSGGALPSNIVGKNVAGTLNAALRWRGLERMLAHAFGFEQPDDSPVLIGTGEGTKTVTNATDTTPIIITVSSHGYSNGNGIRIADVGGNTAANGDWTIANVAAMDFELVGSAGNGTYTSGGTSEKYNADAHLFELDYSSQHRAWVATDDRAAGGWSANDRLIRTGHLGLLKETNDYIWTNVMCTKVTFSGTPTEMKVAFDLVGYDLLRGDYSSDTWTFPAGSVGMALFQQAVIRFGTRAAAISDPLTLTVIEPSSFEVAIDLGLKVDDRTPGTAPNILQPVRSGRYDVTYKLEFPRHSSETESTQFEIDTAMSSSIIVTGPQIAATGEYRKYSIFLPYLNADDRGGPQTGGESPLTKTYNLRASVDAADPFETDYYKLIGMKRYGACVLMLQNEDSCNYMTEV